MLTFFTTPKAFLGHIAVIQRNALKSWKLLHPDIEVIVFGDEEGATQACLDYGLRHEPEVERYDGKTPLVSDMFARAQRLARHDCVCYSNCDVILLQDFRRAVEEVKATQPSFLATGRRWNADIEQAIDFSAPHWEEAIRKWALTSGARQHTGFIDYFVFSRGFFGSEVPPFGVGRVRWDNWMIWKACQSGYPVIDLSRMVVAIHQNHDYGHHAQGKAGVYGGVEAQRNLDLAGGWDHLRSVADATHVLHRGGLRRNWKRYWMVVERGRRAVLYHVYRLPAWHLVLDLTRPLRTALGLRRRSARDEK